MLVHDLLQAAVVVGVVNGKLLVAHLSLLRTSFHVAGVLHNSSKNVTRTAVLKGVLRP